MGKVLSALCLVGMLAGMAGCSRGARQGKIVTITSEGDVWRDVCSGSIWYPDSYRDALMFRDAKDHLISISATRKWKIETTDKPCWY